MVTLSTSTAPGLMLVTGLKQWLDREESPQDFYELVGQPCLCRDRDLLLGRFEEANEYLFQYENHGDKRIRDRAKKLTRQLANARRILSDESRWDQYDADLITRLHKLYRNNPTFSGPNPKLEDLKRWLALVQRVDPNRVEELVEAWTSESAQPNPAKKPKTKKPNPELETQSHAVGQTEELPNIRDHRKSSRSANRTPERSTDNSDTYRLADGSNPPEEVHGSQTSKRPAPPPPPGRNAFRGTRETNGNGVAPPPPPPKDAPFETLVLPENRPAVPEPRSSEFHRRPTSTLPGSPALWIAMAAFLTAVVLGMFGLVVAWAAGAFDGKRSRGAIPREESSFVLHHTPTVLPLSRHTGFRTRSVDCRDLFTTHSA